MTKTEQPWVVYKLRLLCLSI